MAMTTMKDHERLDLLKEIGGTKVYEERREESLKVMKETEGRRLRIQEVVSPSRQQHLPDPARHECIQADLAVLTILHMCSAGACACHPVICVLVLSQTFCCRSFAASHVSSQLASLQADMSMHLGTLTQTLCQLHARAHKSLLC